MIESQVVSIHVFGRTLKLNCPVNEVDSLHAAAKDLDARLNELRRKTQIMNSDQLIITAALNISYELTKEKEKTQTLIECQDRLKKLHQLLDSALIISS